MLSVSDRMFNFLRVYVYCSRISLSIFELDSLVPAFLKKNTAKIIYKDTVSSDYVDFTVEAPRTRSLHCGRRCCDVDPLSRATSEASLVTCSSPPLCRPAMWVSRNTNTRTTFGRRGEPKAAAAIVGRRLRKHQRARSARRNWSSSTQRTECSPTQQL